jgi:hypothetical protein
MGKLSRRFTFSYVLVTLVAALTIEIATTLVPAIQEVQRGRTSDPYILNKQDIQRFASYLQRPAPNSEALRYWIAIPAFDTLSRTYPSLSLIAVTNAHGHILASTACGTDTLLSAPTFHCPRAADEQADAILNLPQTVAYPRQQVSCLMVRACELSRL